MKKVLTLMVLVFYYGAICEAADSGLARGDILDLALIYQGGAHRIGWTAQEIEPYVTHCFADGSEDWLFDGYLFLEFKDGRGRQFSPGYDSLNARRQEWEWYIGRLFEKGRSLSALDSVISTKRQLLGEPGFRHKVILTLMVPIPGQTDWGEIRGEKMDFSRRDHQLKAIKWMIDTLTSRFSSENYSNIDLTGFYWIDEDKRATQDLTADVAPYIHSYGKKFYWIPYFKAPGAENWRNLGFDIAYQQPNHFFDSTIPDSRLDEAVDIAFRAGMAMEFECDERALSQSKVSFQSRMQAYIDVFERRGVFDNASVAYYTGNHLLLDIRRNPSPSNRSIADRLASIIVSRRTSSIN